MIEPIDPTAAEILEYATIARERKLSREQVWSAQEGDHQTILDWVSLSDLIRGKSVRVGERGRRVLRDCHKRIATRRLAAVYIWNDGNYDRLKAEVNPPAPAPAEVG